MNTLLKLNADNLSSIAESTGVAIPTYDRSQVTPGIVHFGVGGFHRAHQAMYLDRLMNDGKNLDWGIIGMGVMPSDVRMRDALAGQNHLYTLTTKAPDGKEDQRVIGSIIDYVFAPDDPRKAVDTLAQDAIRIVSLTVTEGGYNIDPATGEFAQDNPRIVADREALQAGQTWKLQTFFGLITAALLIRKEAGKAPFTIMSCDNIQGNGDLAKKFFRTFATSVSEDLGNWVRENVAFPNSMVDRITPETTDDDRADVARGNNKGGYLDTWPVVSEDFTQWVLEDSFTQGRPNYEDAGVQVVDDVEPYELMKLRLLNASHQGLCYFGRLAGHHMVHDVMADQRFRMFLLAYMEREATPTLKPLPGVDLDAYRHQLIARFGNAAVKDTVPRLCAESSDRIPKWLLPVVRENLSAGRDVTLSAAIVASWARYAEGVDEQDQPINVVDNLKERVMENASGNRSDALAFLRDRGIFGDLIDNEEFTKAYVDTLNSLHHRGAEATLDAVLAQVTV
ncbi:Mannitol 2-dehydrogenase [Corynebacterium deserti GIMN1.010]|uniref:Mannitol-1-phosphate 5-dehydrogenase n=1 Tax=Corynebacterium deserti GIMN1.010 TaxID=931089 RepID=A0A0M3Q8X7_9CORY|nr:mannitol dehydrogenase family protein [Corynebacterium deserti]ALC04623.1 Mannitol 2-dehydrogenase [Corynebacterium deserti GIMN1.010]